MKTEKELRILDVSFETMIQKLKAVGAKHEATYFQERYTYNFTPHRIGHWIRLRRRIGNESKITLAIKEAKKQSVDGTKELEIGVSNFEDTNLILEKLGYKAYSFEENFRIEFSLGKVKVDLDKWPGIPPLMEIEGELEDDIFKTTNILGFDEKDFIFMGIKTLYKEKYGISLDDDQYKYLKFSETEREDLKQYK